MMMMRVSKHTVTLAEHAVTPTLKRMSARAHTITHTHTARVDGCATACLSQTDTLVVVTPSSHTFLFA